MVLDVEISSRMVFGVGCFTLSPFDDMTPPLVVRAEVVVRR